jgi:hypothetical protein
MFGLWLPLLHIQQSSDSTQLVNLNAAGWAIGEVRFDSIRRYFRRFRLVAVCYRHRSDPNLFASRLLHFTFLKKTG